MKQTDEYRECKYQVNVVSNFEKSKFGVEIIRFDGQGSYEISLPIMLKYGREDAFKIAQEIELKLSA